MLTYAIFIQVNKRNGELRSKYDGKVDCHDMSRLNFVKKIKPGVSLYTLIEGELLFKLPN
jgi:hypothetical protein